ncbi:MAG: DUF2029 domain-containing protein [Bacteroidia bacterium]|nr:DUF2029 domain-containing protein [Bacteroidia bacterium]
MKVIYSSLLKDKRGRSKIPLAKSRLFWVGLSIKLIISIFFASSYLRELFAPFGNYFIGSGFQDPYQFFLENGKGVEFPYPPFMLFLFTLPRLLIWPLFPGNWEVFTMVDSLIYRLPLLAADLVILFVLIRWLKTRTRQILIWYWLSPVLIYINYFHGQLDVIPMALMMTSLYFLFKSKWTPAFVILGLAIAAKTNMVLVLPFYILYLFKASQVQWNKILVAVIALVLTLVLINLPYLNSPAFIQMVYNNPVQQQIFDLYYQFNSSLKIYFIPAVYFILVIYYFNFKFVNRDQLILFLAFTFLALTLMIAPMQGWYYWILPLLVYFIIKQGGKERQIFILLSILYFIYFGLIDETDYSNSGNLVFLNLNGLTHLYNSDKALNVTFTLLQTTLILIGYLVFKKGISSNIQSKFLSQPYLIGIGGDSASGKSTLSNALEAVFEKNNTSIVRGDDMHKWERGNENWNTFTHLDPRANKIHQDMEHARDLKSGKSIQRRKYDHSTGKFTLPKFIKPNKLLVFEGLHSFYLNNQAEVYDLRIFMEPDEKLRIWWKVQRDVEKRGYSPEKVLEQLKLREEDSQRYIRSQAALANIIASYYAINDIDPINQSILPVIGLKLSLTNEIDLDPLLDRFLTIKSLDFEHQYEADRQIILIKGLITKEQVELLADRCLPELEDIGIYNSVWKDNFEGVLQLIVTYTIFNSLKFKE